MSADSRPNSDDLETVDVLLSLARLSPWERAFLEDLAEKPQWYGGTITKFDEIKERSIRDMKGGEHMSKKLTPAAQSDAFNESVDRTVQELTTAPARKPSTQDAAVLAEANTRIAADPTLADAKAALDADRPK